MSLLAYIKKPKVKHIWLLGLGVWLLSALSCKVTNTNINMGWIPNSYSNQSSMPLGAGALAGIGAVGSIASDLFGNMGSARAQRRAQEWNLQQWHRQNAYNSPQAQMQRFKDAGLNPNLIYGRGNSGNAGAVAPAKAPDFKFKSPIQDMARYADTSLIPLQRDNLEAQTMAQEASANLTDAKTLTEATKNNQNKFDLALAKDARTFTLAGIKARAEEQQQNALSALIKREIADATKADTIAIKGEELRLKKSQVKGQDLLNEIRDFEKILNSAGIQKTDPLYFRIFMQILGADGLEDLKNTSINPIKD